MKSLPKPYTCRVVDYDAMMVEHGYPVKPFKNGDLVLMLGEIEFSSGHVAVVTSDGLVRWGYHAENFQKLTKDEV